MLKVTDTETGRTGELVRSGGYVMGSHYVNPQWEIQWDDVPELEDEEDDD
jgi:hypothetical protein